MLHLEGYEPGANITIINVFYERPRKEENGKYGTDYVTIVFKDNETGIKHVQTIATPQYTYYIAKPELQIGFNMEWIEREKVDPVTCNYKDIKKSIAEQTGNMDLYMENIRSGNYRLNDSFFAHPRIFAADMNILNYIRMEFAATYQNPVCPITVAYYDIENDIIDALSDDVVIGESPINAVSLYFDKTNTVYSFVLRNDRNPQIQALEEDMKHDFKKYRQQVNDFILKNLGSEQKVDKYRLRNMEVSVGFFDTEIELIVSFFEVMRRLSPDMAVAYNASYDLCYLAARIEKAGLDPATIICDPDFPRKFYYYFVDENNINKIEERTDYVMAGTRTVWIDQMIVYVSRRKGQGAILSHKLDSVVDTECHIHKLDWSHIAKRFAEFAYNDFKTFWLYNINDTIVQACLEAQTEDLRYVFNNVIEMNTPYQKIFRQTNYLSTKGAEFYKNHEGVIMGCNTNRFGQKPNEKFPGAFVARPTLLSNKNKVSFKGIHIMKFNNGDDFDYKALYPSLLREFNMSISTQIGMIQMDNPPYKGHDYLRLGNGGNFNENLASYNFIEFCHRWLYLPDIEQMLNMIGWYFDNMRTPQYKVNAGVPAQLPMDKSHKVVMYQVDKRRPVAFIRPMPDWVKNEVDNIRRRITIE